MLISAVPGFTQVIVQQVSMLRSQNTPFVVKSENNVNYAQHFRVCNKDV